MLQEDSNTTENKFIEITKKVLNKLGKLAKFVYKQTLNLYRHLFWSSNQWLQYAEKLDSSGETEKALLSCDKAIKKDENNYSAWCKKAYIVSEQENYEQAISYFDEAIKIDPTLHKILAEKAKILIILERYDQANETYDQAIKVQPQLDSLWIEKGDLLTTQNQPRLAANCYEKALALNTRDETVSQKLKPLLNELQASADNLLDEANHVYESGNYQKSYDLCDQAVTLKPDFVEAWYARGNSLGKMSRIEEAMVSYDQSLELNPSYYLSLVGKGDLFAQSEYYQKALDCYNQALTIQPDDQEILSKSEQMSQELQNLEEQAEELLRQGIDLRMSNQYQEALNVYEQALQLISNNLA